MGDTNFDSVVASTFTGALVGNVTGNLTGNVSGTLTGGHQDAVQAASADGAVTIAPKTVFITKAGVAALTLADPTATTHDGIRIIFIATTANAHTISNAAGSGFFSSGGSGKDIATLGGAIGDRFGVIAYQGKWYVIDTLNATLG